MIMDHTSSLTSHKYTPVAFRFITKRAITFFYDELYAKHRDIKLHEQKKSVRSKPNPPNGELSVNNNRPEGYVEYQPGMFYVSAFSLSPRNEDIIATAAQALKSKSKNIKSHHARWIKDRNQTKRRERSCANIRENIHANKIVDSATWTKKLDRQSTSTRCKHSPGDDAKDGELLVTTTHTVAHSPKAAGLNGELLIDSVCDGNKYIAHTIVDAVNDRFGRRKCGRFTYNHVRRHWTEDRRNNRSHNKESYLEAVFIDTVR